MGNEVTGLEEFTPMWGGGAAPIGIMPPQRAPDPMAVQPEVAPEDPVDYFSRKFPPQPDYVRDGYQYEQDAFVTAYGDQVNDHQFTNIEEYIDFVEGLTLPSGQPFPPEIDAFKRKFAMEFKQPAVGRDLAERQEARKAESKFEQGMDRNLRMQKKIDEQYGEGRYIYNAETGGYDKDDTAIKLADREDKAEDRRLKRISTLMTEIKRLEIKPGDAPITGVLADMKRDMENELQELRGGTAGGNQNKEAVQWAQANPNDPRAAQILAINGVGQ